MRALNGQCFHIQKDKWKLKFKREKKIPGAILDLPANQHSQSSPILLKYGWIGCADLLVDPKRPPGYFLSFMF